MTAANITLTPLTEDDREQFILDTQYAFKYGAVEEFGMHDDHLDGVGFDPAGSSDNNDPHIALNNIKHWLEMTCKGKLTISPREGGGTSVKITIPQTDR